MSSNCLIIIPFLKRVFQSNEAHAYPEEHWLTIDLNNHESVPRQIFDRDPQLIGICFEFRYSNVKSYYTYAQCSREEIENRSVRFSFLATRTHLQFH